MEQTNETLTREQQADQPLPYRVEGRLTQEWGHYVIRDSENAPVAYVSGRQDASVMAVAWDLLEALRLFMDMCNSGDSGRSSKRAQERRAKMWDKANAAIRKATEAV